MACMAMQFKTMTQMTQMTQGHADVLTWCMLAPAGNMWHGGQWPPAGPPPAAGNTHNASRGTGRAERQGAAQTYGS